MHRETLECHDIVLRAVLRSSNIDREKNVVLFADFLLRTFEDGSKEENLSVLYDCSPEECAADFRKCYGVATLHIGRIRNLGLDVKPDSDQADDVRLPHAEIAGLPHKKDNPAEAERFARQLQRQARLT